VCILKYIILFFFINQIIPNSYYINSSLNKTNLLNIYNDIKIQKYDYVVFFNLHNLSDNKELKYEISRQYELYFPKFDGVIEFNYEYQNKIFSFIVVGKDYFSKFYDLHINNVLTQLYIPIKIYAQYINKYERFNLKLKSKIRPLKNYPNRFVLDNFLFNFTSCFRSLLNIDKPVLLSSFDLYNVFDKKPIWSILICTLKSRHSKFYELYKHLLKQINDLGMQDKIEILFCSDDKNITVGKKRNILLENAKGDYVAFADDDDWLSDDYVARIYEALLNKPDCVSLVGEITFDGKDPHLFIHSLRYNSWYEENGVYYRFPNHLNPIKRSIATQFKYPEINCSEDYQWAEKVFNSGLLKNEVYLDEPYYFYRFNSKETETQG
jgi:hypothetical protein